MITLICSKKLGGYKILTHTVAAVVQSTNVELILDYLQLHKLKRSTIFVFHCKNLQLHSSLGLDDKQTFFEKNEAKAFSCIFPHLQFCLLFLNCKLRDEHHLSNAHKKCRLLAKIKALLLIFRFKKKCIQVSFGHFWESI